jgi:DNA-binding transcriptional LysR family regulator
MLTLHSFHASVHIMHDALRRLDLNLLLVFDALFRHRSVSAAADDLALSPSACSHALSRLRVAMSDELFLRYESAMQPTALAQEIAASVSQALALLSETMTSAAPFRPETSTQTFVFAATDFTAFALLPALVAKLERAAPHVCLKVVHATQRDSADDLAAGRIHFALGFADETSMPMEGVESLRCFVDDYVVVSRRGHPRIKRTLSLKQYLTERHVVVVPWSGGSSVIDTALARQGLSRDVAVQLPSVMSAPFIISSSDMLLTFPRRAARQLGSAVPLTFHETPFDAPPYMLEISHHARHAHSASHRWMRDLMIAAFGKGAE